DIQTFDDFAEDRVFEIEVRSGGDGDKELAAVGVGTGVGHGEDPGTVMKQGGGEFVSELVAGAVGALSIGRSALDHETCYDAMESEPVVKGALDEALGGIDERAGT